MKTFSIQLLLYMAVLTVSCTESTPADIPEEKKNTSLRGNRAPAEYMTGTVWLYPFATDSVKHWSSAKVTFEAGAHSNWHTHPGKQVLVIADGTGYLKEQGKPVQILHKGDVAEITPGTLHWHGATPEGEFTQIVINPEIEKGVVNWLDRVTEEEYKSVTMETK